MTELAVLVPVLNRPANVEPLVESFLANCPNDSFIWFLCSDGDQDEWDAVSGVRSGQEGRVALSSGGSTWPTKINIGAQCRGVNWYLCAADDIRFTEGWWEATKELRNDSRIGVIGTNDSHTGQGNPRVASGDHTCHPLIRSNYIRECGSIDEIGKAVHDGYRHVFVDDELVITAKIRNAWAFCREAVIEHLHPFWGTAADDDTYRLGNSPEVYEHDGALFRERMKLLGIEVR